MMKNWTTWTLALLLSLYSILSYGQAWEKSFYEQGSLAHSVLPSPDGGLIGCGFIVETAAPGVTNYYSGIFKLSAEGDIEWEILESTDGVSDNNVYQKLTYLQDGHILAVGGDDELPTARAMKISLKGDTLWHKAYNLTNNLIITQSLELDNGEILLTGTDPTVGEIQLLKIGQTGDVIWGRSYENSGFQSVYLLTQNSNGFTIVGDNLIINTNLEGQEIARHIMPLFVFYGAAQAKNGNILIPDFVPSGDTRLWEFSTDGEIIDSTTLTGTGFPNSIFVSPEGEVWIGGTKLIIEDPQIFGWSIAQINDNKEIIFQKTIDLGFPIASIPQLNVLNRFPNRNFAMLSSGGTNNGLIIAYSDSLGNINNSVIRGNALNDTNFNCLEDIGEPGLENWLVKAESTDHLYYSYTDTDGFYQLDVDTGTYDVTLIHPNIYWEACEPSLNVSVNSFDTITLDYAVQEIVQCPLLNVDIGTPFLRRCYPNTYTANYCNEGTVVAEDATLTVVLDPAFELQSSTPLWDQQIGDTLIFNLGDVEAGDCGNVLIDIYIPCGDTTTLGQSHCVEAYVTPDSLCTPPNTNWDQSSVEVLAKCEGDSVKMEIRNVGDAPMQVAKYYIVIVDDVIHKVGDFQLDPAEQLNESFYATGQSWRIEAEQSSGHPGSSMPSDMVEGCAASPDSTISIGYLPQFPLDEGDPFVAMDCQSNIGSWDPNDKTGFPLGLSDNHYINANTQIEYRIRFQNTGTDTAFAVVIRDTLPLELNWESIRPGASSHPYEFELLSDGALKIEFPGIELPDSTTNERLSNGFIQFKIDQVPDLAPGTLIENTASIYFDFNYPVVTNTYFHTIKSSIQYDLDTICTGMASTLSDTIFVDSLSDFYYESNAITRATLAPSFNIEKDTLLIEGTLFRNQLIIEEISFTDSLITQYNCDSIVTTFVFIPEKDIEFEMYPNPVASETVNIKYLQSKPSDLTISLYDILGRKCSILGYVPWQTPGLYETSIPVEEIPAGLYFLRLEVDGYHSEQKIIIH